MPRGEGREVEAKNKSAEKQEGGRPAGKRYSIVLRGGHRACHTEATHAENNACLYLLSVQPNLLLCKFLIMKEMRHPSRVQ